jgi:thiol-disulfide isomerase/thioredoxin
MIKQAISAGIVGCILFGGWWFWLHQPSQAEETPANLAPEFTKVSEWLNTKPLQRADLKGKVVVIHFWTNGCINCINNYPHYRAWQERYAKQPLFMNIGIHSPEFEGEKSIKRIQEQMTKHKLTFAVAVDNEMANWQAWKNRYWPCVYVVDAAGVVQFRWEGELGEKGYQQATEQIDRLLKLIPQPSK